MSHQLSLTVVATVRSDAVESLSRLLADMAKDPAGNAVVPFGQMSRVHFARLVLLDEVRDGDGELIGPRLLLISDVDAPLDAHLEQLASVAGSGLDALFGHCDDYPSGHVTADDRRRFLQDHSVDNPAVYVHRIGRTVDQIRQEQRLREAIEELVDRNIEQWKSFAPETIHAAVRRQIGSEPSLAWALRKPRGPGVVARVRDAAHLVGVAAMLLVLTPVMLIVAPFYAVALRWHEWRDPAPGTRPDPTHVARLAESEDFVAHNQFTALGFLKPGRFRRYTAVVALFLLNYGCRHFFAKANLAGVRTIHFARWVFLDDKRRLLFASNYDGSLESYMDDFIDKVAWGLNLVFSNGLGYPKTSWLVRGGARDEQAFKRYIRLRQVSSQVWYSAYPDLTAINIENNSAIRAGLAKRLDRSEAQAWMARL